MDALRRSVQTGKSAPNPKAKKSKKRAEGQREMLLPISGKAPSQGKAAKPVRSNQKRARAS
jgi:DNA end-binding protein Ku